MKLLEVVLVIIQVAVLSVTISCSNSEDPGQKSVIKETQGKIAEKATNNIKDPMDKAKIASELINEHNQKIEEEQ